MAFTSLDYHDKKYYEVSISFFFQAEDGIRDLVRSRGLGDVYKRQTQSSDKGWHISISKADTFKVVMGTKTALNVELAPKGDGTDVSAGIGVFGQHGGGLGGVLAGPLMLTQLWGMVQQLSLIHI